MNSLKYSKYLKFGISALAFLIIASTVLSLATIVVDFYGVIDNKKEDLSIDDTPTPPNDDDEKNPPENESDGVKYVNNLSFALGAGFVEGLYTDISLADEAEISAMYKKLTEKIPYSSSLGGMKLSAVGVYRSGDFVLSKADIELPMNSRSVLKL